MIVTGSTPGELPVGSWQSSVGGCCVVVDMGGESFQLAVFRRGVFSFQLAVGRRGRRGVGSWELAEDESPVGSLEFSVSGD
jgi:hypothetical protein